MNSSLDLLLLRDDAVTILRNRPVENASLLIDSVASTKMDRAIMVLDVIIVFNARLCTSEN